ncbi:hypothetical protein R75461_06003 [Paraburkholderia nemoris]|nr:hypothetical protein [Paraburkholderia aspalathi]CAE6818798.1 hypothetical protein R75461_06003 [Paraburkholderia nemoris]
MIMATGIVPVAAHLLSYDIVGRILLGINAVWPIPPCLPLRHAAFCAIRMRCAPIASHGRGPGIPTLVAATAVLGSQLSTYHVLPQALPWLLGLADGFWLVVAYTFLAAMIIEQRKPGLHTGLNGTWLLLVVTTESTAVLATTNSFRRS